MGSFAPLAPAGFPNVALANFMKSYQNNKLVGDILFPRVPVDRQSFPYVIFDLANLRLDGVGLVAPGAKPMTIRSTFSTDKYFCDRYAFDAEIPWQVEQYALGMGFSEKQRSIQVGIDKLQNAREVQIAQLVTNPANMPNTLNLSSTYPWDNYTSSHPIVDVDNGKTVIRQMGVEANSLIISEPTYLALRNHPDIIARFQYSTLGAIGGAIGINELSSVFGVPVYRAAGTVRSNTNAGSWIWGANAVLGYTEPTPGLSDLSLGKTFVWTSAPAGRTPDGTLMPSTDGYSVIEWPDAHLSTMKDWASGSWFYDLKLTAPETGFLFTNTCTPAAFGTFPAPTGE